MYPPSEEKTIKKVQEYELIEREDIGNFYHCEMGFEVLQAMLLKDYHRVLLPFVYFEHFRKEKAWQKQQQQLFELQLSKDKEEISIKDKDKDCTNAERETPSKLFHKFKRILSKNTNNNRNKIKPNFPKNRASVKNQKTHKTLNRSKFVRRPRKTFTFISRDATFISNREKEEQRQVFNAVQDLIKRNYGKSDIQKILDQFMVQHLPDTFLKLCQSGRSPSYVFIHGRNTMALEIQEAELNKINTNNKFGKGEQNKVNNDGKNRTDLQLYKDAIHFNTFGKKLEFGKNHKSRLQKKSKQQSRINEDRKKKSLRKIRKQKKKFTRRRK